MLRRGEAELALGPFEKALKIFTNAKDAKGIAISHDGLGDLYSVQGQYAVAVGHYQKANEAFLSVNDAYNANLMLASTGDMFCRAGKYAEAREVYGRMTVPKIDTSVMGKVNQVLDKVGKAKVLVDKGRAVAAAGLNLDTANKVTALAADAKTAVDQERESYRQYIVFSIYELGMGRLDYASLQLESAKAHFGKAHAAADNPIYGKFGQSRRWRVAARTSLGDIALQQNKYAEAVKQYSSASDGARKDNRADLRWPAQRGVGRSKWLQASVEKDKKKSAKLRDEAIVAYREALTTIEALRAGSISADESRATFLATTKDVFDEAINALAERALMNATPGKSLAGPALADASEAFRIVEQGRARSLLDMLAEANANITEGISPELLKAKQYNLNRQQEVAYELYGMDGSDDEKKKSDSDLEVELNTLAKDFDSIENQIKTANPRYTSLTAPQPLTIVEVQNQILDGQTALLEYSLGVKDSYVWVVTNDGVNLFKLPSRAVVEQQARDFRDAIVPAKLRRQIVGVNAIEPTRGLGLSTAQGPDSVGTFVAASSTLYKSVIEPAAGIAGNKRLVIVADGALNYVPFEALIKSGDATAGFAALPYLITTNEIIYSPSVSVIPILRKQALNKSASKNVLVIADPIYSLGDARLKAVPPVATKGAGKRPARGGGKATTKGGGKKTVSPVAAPSPTTAPVAIANDETRGLGLSNALTDVAGMAPASSSGSSQKNPRLARLPGTRIEATQIAQITQQSGGIADVWLDLNANEGNVQTKDLKNYRVLHLATHGLLNPKRPQFTGVVLSLVGNRSGDGFLATSEVFNLKLGSPLVMLSACETGLGTETRGEGVIGLTRAFMYAGAPTVGVSLWSVADSSTPILMSEFYQRLLGGQGMSPSAAMRGAQQSLITGKTYAAPFYWAPFVLVGDWR
jgi:CHAT domain-containing protein